MVKVRFRENPGGPPVPDVDALMRQVQSGVADKLGSGFYPPADLEELHRVVIGKLIVTAKRRLRRLAALERRNQEPHARCDELPAAVRGLQTRLDSDGPAEKPE